MSHFRNQINIKNHSQNLNFLRDILFQNHIFLKKTFNVFDVDLIL